MMGSENAVVVRQLEAGIESVSGFIAKAAEQRQLIDDQVARDWQQLESFCRVLQNEDPESAVASRGLALCRSHKATLADAIALGLQAAGKPIDVNSIAAWLCDAQWTDGAVPSRRRVIFTLHRGQERGQGRFVKVGKSETGQALWGLSSWGLQLLGRGGG